MKKLFLPLLVLLLSACNMPNATPTITPTVTASVTPTAVIPPTAVPTFTPSPYLMYPYTLAGLRQRSYPGGKINLRGTPRLTDAYTRWQIDYPSDGLTITGVLQIPRGAGPFPVIVLNHGYVNRWEYKSGDGTDRLAEALNHANYITISPDYRGWGGSTMGESLFYTGLATDVLNLLASIPSIEQADPQRVGMLGHSMGGGVTSKVLAVDSGTHVRAAVLYAPVSADDADIFFRWGFGCVGDAAIATCTSADIAPDAVPVEVRDAYLKALSDPQILRETSPIHHLEWISAPIQIHIGSADGQYISAVPPEWSKKFYEALEKAGKPAEFFLYEDQGHSFVGVSRELFLQRIVTFFDKWVKTPAP